MGAPQYEIRRGRLYVDRRPLDIPKGFLFVSLARAGWKGEEGPLSADFIRRLRLVDPRLGLLYLKPDRGAAA